ncbi:MAG: winged helix-turn-helix transcriptional regulator [Lysobacterales bacterium]
MFQVSAPLLSLSLLVKLTHRRWCIPALAEFAHGGNAKFITLAHRLGCGRGALSASLKHLIDLELVMRNSGMGHPLRPEYLLTDQGHAIAQPCARLHDQVTAWNGQGLAYRKWSLPLIMAVGPTQQRFNDLKKSLDPISPRALALSLQHLEHGAFVARAVTAHYPPIAHYSLLQKGEQLLYRLSI